MKKRILGIFLLVLLTFTACGQAKPTDNTSMGDVSEPTSQPTSAPTVEPTSTPIPTPTEIPVDTSQLEPSEIPLMYSNPDNYKNRGVALTGKVFGTPEYGEDGVYFQMFQNHENSENNTVVCFPDNSLEVKSGDYVSIVGFVAGTYTGTNAYGGTVTAPTIVCIDVQVKTYAEIASPTLSTKQIDKSITQNGYEVVLEKIEFADNETRLYITVNNNGKANFDLYDFNSKIVQGKKQYEHQDNWKADYPEIQTDLMPDVTTSGIICFPKLDYESPMTIYLDGSSDNYREDFELYTFKID